MTEARKAHFNPLFFLLFLVFFWGKIHNMLTFACMLLLIKLHEYINLYAKCVRVVTLMHRDKPKEDPFGSHGRAAAIVLGVYCPKDL